MGKAAFAAGALAAGTSRPGRAMTKRKKPAMTELIKVGTIALGDNSHMNYGIWAPMFNPAETDAWPCGRLTKMRITHCWDSRPEIAENFAAKYKCDTVKNYYDMVDHVDAMVFAGFNEVKWWPQLSKPYLEAGIPCFLNRPFAYSMKAAKEIVETAKKHNTPILCTDEREYIQQAILGRVKVENLLREGKTIVGGSSTNSAGNEYPQHGVHGLYFMLAIFGLDVEQISFQSDGWWREKTIATDHPMSWGIISLKYNGLKIDGVGEQKSPFVVAQHQKPSESDADMTIHYSGGNWFTAHNFTRGEGFNRLFYLFYPTVVAMQRMFETKKMQWSYDYILKKTKIFVSGFKSHLEHNGAFIPVADLNDDWEAPCPYPDCIDEKMFE